ncbi:MAG: LacI family DNA-binding transcriptional regulator [Candidatus Omnitrophica bacterium]|nr:LacI family DNA-binding transcriptional regulator [Candidatus Omnitrophota bacterium]HOX55016.1 LacI family DNA-binding transcriptional regulator [Candidatus Omnitrophota bacterium]
MAEKKVRIEDVAKLAGVSITTVSRVINKIPTVTEDNRKRTEEAIRKLKFRPDVTAQRLAKGVNYTVGLVIPRYEGIFFSFFAMEIIRGVGMACEGLKLDLLLHISNGRTPVNLGNMGGVIFADILGNEKDITAALDENIPCIVINNVADAIGVNYIAVDNLGGAKKAVEYLVNIGHKKIATIAGDPITQAGVQRLEGYKTILEKNGIAIKDEYIVKGDYSRRSARIAAEKLLNLKEPPTAIFAASDDMALEAVEVILEKGLKVPEDISVLGFDDNPACLYGPVTLTTVKQPLFEMAQEAVRELQKIIAGKTKTLVKKILPAELVIRESCANAKSK